MPGVQDTTTVFVLQSSEVLRPLWGQGPTQGDKIPKILAIVWETDKSQEMC